MLTYAFHRKDPILAVVVRADFWPPEAAPVRAAWKASGWESRGPGPVEGLCRRRQLW